MISKSVLHKRLNKAIGQEIDEKKFSMFFLRFCEVYGVSEKVKNAHQLDDDTVMAFSEYAGYDLRFPIPLPLTAKK